MPRTTTQMVGRTVVYVDSRNEPYRFVRDGAEVECICDPESGLKCTYHQRTMAEQAIPAERIE
jgi:hypothetical protein